MLCYDSVAITKTLVKPSNNNKTQQQHPLLATNRFPATSTSVASDKSLVATTARLATASSVPGRASSVANDKSCFPAARLAQDRIFMSHGPADGSGRAVASVMIPRTYGARTTAHAPTEIWCRGCGRTEVQRDGDMCTDCQSTRKCKNCKQKRQLYGEAARDDLCNCCWLSQGIPCFDLTQECSQCKSIPDASGEIRCTECTLTWRSIQHQPLFSQSEVTYTDRSLFIGNLDYERYLSSDDVTRLVNSLYTNGEKKPAFCTVKPKKERRHGDHGAYKNIKKNIHARQFQACQGCEGCARKDRRIE